MATNSGRGNNIASEDNPPTPDLHPPPVSDDLKKEIRGAETGGEATGKRAAGHDESSSLPATSVATGEQAEKVIRTAGDIGGK